MFCLVAVSGGCRPELPDNLFVCSTDDECPDQFVCVAAEGSGRCVRGVRSESAIEEADAGRDGGASDRPDADTTVRTRPDSGTPMQATSKPPRNTDAGTASKPDAGMMSVDVPPAPDCLEDSDCTAASACALARCNAGRCDSEPLAEGVPLSAAEQVQADCQELVCDGKGSVTTRPQADDLPPDDGNVCLKRVCANGEPDRSALPDGESCNGTGQCQAGACSVCQGGSDCTRPNDCTIHRTECVAGRPECTDTGMSIDGKTCGIGRVCSAKQCVPCVLGAACGPSATCQRSRITSCAMGPVCTTEPLNGTSCGNDRVCAAGSCVYTCPTSACGDNPCQTGSWDCSDPSRAPVCSMSPAAEGTACGDDSTCRAGTCSRTALVNGDFRDGFRGWDLTGDAQSFLIGVDANHFNRRFVTTWINSSDGNGDIAKGSVSQRFTVPADALALRFLVSGGHAHVRLRDASGTVIQDVTGIDSNDRRIPVSWDLRPHRGRAVTISIDDELDTGGWSFVAALGFDVIRELDAPLRNSQFASGLDHWDQSGDGSWFGVWDDSNYLRTAADNMLEHVPAYGTRGSITSYVQNTSAPRQFDAAVGTVSQRFEVPADAVAMRFNLHGGRLGRVELREGNNRLYVASGTDDNAIKIPISWDLTPHRGKSVEVAIIDDQGSGSWTFVSSTGFDIITSYNGP